MNSISILLACGLTLAVYAASRCLNTRLPSPLTNPVVVATPCVIAILVAADIDYPTYRAATEPLAMLLGPSVVALAVPLYRQRQAIAARAMPALAALVLGGLGTAAAAVALARLFGLTDDLVLALAIKSATAPIALQVAPLVGADPGLAAVLAIGTGMCGALLGPFVLDLCAVRDPLCRGLAYGVISHGIGTAQASAEGEMQGAVSAVAMGLAALLVALAVPPLVRAMS